MFGHDNQDDQNHDHHDQNNHNEHHDDNNDGQGQINLPAAGGFGTDDASDNPVGPSSAITDFGDPGAPDHRAITKTGAPTDDLLDIKQDALKALTPLVDHLDQTPEEKFRTTMMMIQASDNHSLIKLAYEAAQQIGNEKERAQALLDIVNEINYFTQHSQAVA